MRARRFVALALVAAGGGCDLYIRPDDADAVFNDGRPPADALELDGGRDAGFGDPTAMPTAPTRAHQPIAGGWIDVGPPDWSCLGTPRDATTAEPLTLSGRTVDWETRSIRGNMDIVALPSPGLGKPLGMVRSGASSADFATVFDPLPAGATRYAFQVTGAFALPNFILEQYFAPGIAQARDLAVVGAGTAEQFPQQVGLVRDITRALVFGEIVDCVGRPVSNAKAIVSAQELAISTVGAVSANFNASTPSRPSVLNLPTNSDGRFLALGVPADTPVFLQVWGFRTSDELLDGEVTRLATVRLRLPADSVATVVMEPRQSP